MKFHFYSNSMDVVIRSPNWDAIKLILHKGFIPSLTINGDSWVQHTISVYFYILS